MRIICVQIIRVVINTKPKDLSFERASCQKARVNRCVLTGAVQSKHNCDEGVRDCIHYGIGQIFAIDHVSFQGRPRTMKNKNNDDTEKLLKHP